MSRQRGKIWFQFKRNNQLDAKKICLGEFISNVDLEELPIFKFEVLAMSTNQFHDNNKVGQGGFGPVYKVSLFFPSSGPIRSNASSCKCNCLVV